MNINKKKYISLGIITVLVICSIWMPPIRQYWFFFSPVTNEQIQEAINKPSNDVFKEIVSISDKVSRKDHKAALNLINGIAVDPINGQRNIDLPFSKNDVVSGSSQWQLAYASFSFPDILIREYESTGDRKFLLLARDMIYHFLSWEKKQLIYTGMIWNDHTLSNQIMVLTRFWYHYRMDKDYDPAIAKEVLLAVERISTRLASPTVFTYNTNHGIMENVALLEASMAFPSLPNAETWAKIARTRFERQIEFYFSQEGIVLEHSPSYHGFGLALLSSMIDLDRLSGSSPPSSWVHLLKKGQLAQRFMARPDGSLPMFGDTPGGSPKKGSEYKSESLIPTEDQQILAGMYHFSIFPISGIGGWHTLASDGRTVAHATASWAYFQRNGHSHADELSISLWIEGSPELVNVGYWPDVTVGRQEALSWKGSNAPHFMGEQVVSSRYAPELLAFSDSSELRGLVMLRKAQQGTVQREFFQMGKDTWIVLDVFMGNNNIGEIIWRVNGSLAHPASGNPWVVEGPGQLIGHFLGTRSIKACSNQLSQAVMFDAIKPVPCIILESDPLNSAVLSVWSTHATNQQNANQSLKFISANEWEISGIEGSKWRKLMRKDNKMVLVGLENKDSMEVILKNAPDVSHERQLISTANLKLGKQYPKYYELEEYRYIVTWVCLGLAVLQIFFIYLIANRFPIFLNKIIAMGMISWLALGFYLHYIYFNK